MGSFCIYKQLKRISILCYGEFMESAFLHNILVRCLSFSFVNKCRRIPSYDLKYTLTSLSSKVDREYIVHSHLGTLRCSLKIRLSFWKQLCFNKTGIRIKIWALSVPQNRFWFVPNCGRSIIFLFFFYVKAFNPRSWQYQNDNKFWKIDINTNTVDLGAPESYLPQSNKTDFSVYFKQFAVYS